MRKFAGPLISRIPVLVAVATLLLILRIGTLKHGSLEAAWRPLHIPSTSPGFMDTRTVTHSIDCLLAGENPYFVRSYDPWHRLYNYPPIWLDLRYLGVTSRSTNFLGITLALLLVGSSLLLFRAKTWLAAAFVFLALISRAILFGLERGNIDQLIFASLVFGFFLIDRQQSHRTASLNELFSALLIVLLTILKIYPVVGAIILLRSRNGLFKTILTAVAAIAALLLTSGHDLSLLLANTPLDYMMSFGAFPFFLAIVNLILPSSQSFFVLHRYVAPFAAILLAALSLTAALLFRNRLQQLLPRLDPDHTRGRIAICGLAIFAFAFTFSASYNYRLVFLFGPLAYLVEDLNTKRSYRALLVAVPILCLMWGPFSVSLIHEIPDGLVFVLAIAWLATSLLLPAPSSEAVPLHAAENPPLKLIPSR